MLHHLIRIRGRRPRVTLMPGLRPVGTGLLPPLLANRGRWFCRGARGLLRPVQLQHQLDRLLLAQALQVTVAHPDRESAKPSDGKGGATQHPRRD